MNKALVIGGVVVTVVIVAVGGVLLLRNTNPKSLPAGRQDQIPSPNETVATPTPEASPQATGKTVEVTVEGSSFKFSPATLKVKMGDNVVITFKSKGGIHDFVIDEFDVAANQLGDGEEEEIEFVADKAGTFKYYCSVDGHRKTGMEGILTVEP